MKRLTRLILLLLSLALLGYGLAIERHDVRSLSTNQPTQVGGLAFVSGTTTDDFMRKDGSLYDVRSLLPSWASVKDCKT